MSLRPVTTVEVGFTPEEKIAFRRNAPQLHALRDDKVQWIEPRLCCRIRYLDRTENYNLRIATLEEFVFYKNPDDCRWVS